MVAVRAAVDIGGGNPPGWVIFDRCKFFALATGVDVVLTAPTTGKVVLSNCTAVGVTNWSANSNNILNASGTAVCAADGGLGVVIT